MNADTIAHPRTLPFENQIPLANSMGESTEEGRERISHHQAFARHAS